jgi:dienelactone hydrolase
MRALVLSPLLALSISLAAVPNVDERTQKLIDTNTKFFEEAFPNWPGELTRAQWEKRRVVLQRQILVAAGIDPLPAKRATPRAIVSGKQTFDGFTVENVLLETKPGYWLGGNLYRPLTGSGKRPAIISPHGHWKAGRLEQTETGNIPARGAMMARMGMVVFNYDMVGYNDTKQTPHAFGNELWNWGPLGLQLWNSIRAVDYLSSLPDVDASKLGATGASGGGTQVFLLAAVDDRIRWAAPVNMISGIMQGGSPCENAPGLRIDTFNVEIAALIAPRPLLMVAATGDWTRNTPRDEFPAMKKIYALYDKALEVESVQFNAPHNYNQASREAVYDFFARRILGLAAGPKESNVPRFSESSMLAAPNGLPAGARNETALFAQHQAAAKSVPPSRERLREALHVEWPVQVEAKQDGANFVLSRGRDRVAGRRIGGKGPAVVVIDPAGIDAAAKDARVGKMASAGYAVYLIEPFRRAVPEKARYYHTFQRSEASNQAQDLLTALKWLEKDKPELLGLGDGAVWVRVAAAMAPVTPRVQGDVTAFTGSDADWQRVFPAPGIQWAGGWEAVQRLSKR